MSSAYPGRDFRATFAIGSRPSTQVAAGDTGAGLLKRSFTEQQIQHEMLIRSVKQRIQVGSPISPLNLTASCSSSFEADLMPAPPAESTIKNRLQELERQLLDDDEDEDDEVSVSGSEWSETIQHLISSPPAKNPISTLSPTTSSSSSTASSSSSQGFAPSRQLLLDTSTALADGNMEIAAANLAVLKRTANPRGDPDQRLTAMMVTALLARLNPPAHGSAELCSAEHQAATQLLFDLSPCFKLGLLAANLAILESTRDAPKLHVIDFDVGQGGQHAALIYALSERHSRNGVRPPAVKITAVCDPASSIINTTNLEIVGDRIAKLAEMKGLGLRFSIVNRRPAELDRSVLGCEPGEALAVNLAFQLSRVADESVSPENPRDEVLRRVRDLQPRVVVLVEQEVNGNTARFAARFAEACGHYGALLESLEKTARESVERARVEACLARKAVNAIAREGAERVERCEVFGKWRARMGMAGLRPVQLGSSVVEPVRARLGSLGRDSGFTVREEAGGLCFGWKGRVVTVASAWR